MMAIFSGKTNKDVWKKEETLLVLFLPQRVQ